MSRPRVWWRSLLGGRAFLLVLAPGCFGRLAKRAVGTHPYDWRARSLRTSERASGVNAHERGRGKILEHLKQQYAARGTP